YRQYLALKKKFEGNALDARKVALDVLHKAEEEQ
ncbi:hypothetical protein LCGC14_0944920, partial [marine sediment metagenome]